MNNLRDLTKYKQARKVSKDILEMLGIIHHSLKALEPYSKYKQISNCISVLNENKTLLEIHFNKYKKILRDHGKVEN